MTEQKFKKIYEKLDAVSPVPFDCGRICGEACCQANDNLGIFLLPGEECIRKKSEWASYERMDDCCFVTCRGPQHCDRSTRPIQCRTFPLFPEISPEGELTLAVNTMELPYSCPLIDSDAELDPQFIRVTEQVWRELIEEPAIYALVMKWSEQITACDETDGIDFFR